MSNWGEAFYDHFVRWFKEPVGRAVFDGNKVPGSVQVLIHDRVFAECMTFTSLGLSRYCDEVRGRFEVFLAADDGWEDIPELLANSLFFVVENRMEFGWGVAIGGLPAIRPEFSKRFGKAAIYYTHPVGLPEALASVSPAGAETAGSVLMGVFLSPAEYAFFREHGAQALEQVFQEKEIDPFHVARASAI